MVFLGFGKYARADRIYALEPLRGDERGDGRRTRVWVDGIPEPIVASRTQRSILADDGRERRPRAPSSSTRRSTLAERHLRAGRRGRVDLPTSGRRARHLLEATAAEPDPLF